MADRRQWQRALVEMLDGRVPGGPDQRLRNNRPGTCPGIPRHKAGERLRLILAWWEWFDEIEAQEAGMCAVEGCYCLHDGTSRMFRFCEWHRGDGEVMIAQWLDGDPEQGFTEPWTCAPGWSAQPEE